MHSVRASFILAIILTGWLSFFVIPDAHADVQTETSVIDFNDLEHGAPVNSHYPNCMFSGAVVKNEIEGYPAKSPPRLAIASTGEIRVDFSVRVLRVGAWFATNAYNLTLKAYNASGTVDETEGVYSGYYDLTPKPPVYAEVACKETETISYVVCTNAGECWGMDDFTFEWVPSDTIPPAVIEYSPTGSSVSVSAWINVTFSEATVETSAEGAFSISPSVAGLFSWTVNTMTFTPSSDLAYNTQYTVTIGTGAMDLAGNHLESAFSWQFTTAPSPDATPPEAKISFDIDARKVVVEGVDDSGGPVDVKSEVVSHDKHANVTRYVLTDAAGNTMEIVIRSVSSSNFVSIEVIQVSYENGDSIKPPRNRFTVIYGFDRKTGKLKHIFESIYVKAQFTVAALYSVKMDKTWIFIHRKGEETRTVSEPGLVLLHLVTKKGSLTCPEAIS